MTSCPACESAVEEDARFCPSCGASLATRCASCGADLPEGARFCSACGTAIPVATPTPSGEERKLVTVLFADVTGSTALGERLDPERFREVMSAFASAMREEIEAEGGTVEKFIGDAVMAAFGVPVAHEDDPARACRAALHMLERLEDLNAGLTTTHDVRLQMRVGVNTGEVLASTAPRPGEAMATGDAVNAAARLQSAAEPGRVLVGERTAASARGFLFDAAVALDVKGKREAVLARALLGAGHEGEITERGVPGLRAPMVGRDQELLLLRTVLARVATEARPHLVTIYGDAGVGKSRLTWEFVRWAEQQDPPSQVVRGRCLPYGEGVTYWPLAEILKTHAGVLDSDPSELVLEKIRKAGKELFSADVVADPARATAALSYAVGIVDPDIPFHEMEPRQVRSELHQAWSSFFSGLAAHGTVAAVIEDIHWADPALLDLLAEVADRAIGALLFLCPARPELTGSRPTWGGGRRNVSSLALDPLTDEQAGELVGLLLTIDDLPPSVHASILERAEGNPFFLEEIIRHLIDEGSIVRTGDRWRATGGIEDVHIPDTVQGVLAARIDLLTPTAKRALQGAAVVGRVFWPGPVRQLLNGEAADLDATLAVLRDRELVLGRLGSAIAGEEEYIFKHVLTRDVAYESLPRRERATAHASVARWIEQTVGARSGEFAELLAYHFATAVTAAREAGDEPDPILRTSAHRWLLRASEDARLRLVTKKAERLAEEALLLAADDLERTDALEALAEAFFNDYAGDAAWRYFREAAFVRAGADPPDGLRVAYLAARGCEMPQRWPGSMPGALPPESEVRELFDLGFSMLPAEDSEARIRLLAIRAGWSFAYPDLDAPVEELASMEADGREAADMALRLGRPNLASGALDAANAAWLSRGWYGRMLPSWERRGELLPQVTDILEIGDYFSMGGWAWYELARYPDALRIVDQGLERVTGRGPSVELHLRSWRTAALYRLGDWDAALEEMRLIDAMLDEDRRATPPYFVAHAFAVAGTIHEARGDRVESDRAAARLTSLATSFAGRLHPFLVRLLVDRGDLETAKTRPRPVNWRVHAADAYEADAELLAAGGDRDRAPALLADMRRHAEVAPAPSVAAFADRLEGQVALAAGDVDRGVELLTAASAAFAELEAPWERARTDLVLGEGLTDIGTADDAREVLDRALRTFEELRTPRRIEDVRSLLAELS
ncbi:MAG: adenylate/guanylate cyclase domain-containing protein [Actinomycetota bacterium]